MHSLTCLVESTPDPSKLFDINSELQPSPATPDDGTIFVDTPDASSLVPQHYLKGSTMMSLKSTPSIMDSLLVDLDRVLNLQDSDYKAVKFQPYTPPSMHYMVSNDVDTSCLRRPDKLFPQYLQQNPKTAQDLVASSTTLQAAASKATVKVKDTNHLKTTSHSNQSNHSNHSHLISPSPSPSPPHSHSYKMSVPKMSSNVPSARTGLFIELYIKQNQNPMNKVYFDTISVTESNQKTVLLSSHPLTKGTHEWRIEILKCDVELQVECVELLSVFQIILSSKSRTLISICFVLGNTDKLSVFQIISNSKLIAFGTVLI